MIISNPKRSCAIILTTQRTTTTVGPSFGGLDVARRHRRHAGRDVCNELHDLFGGFRFTGPRFTGDHHRLTETIGLHAQIGLVGNAKHMGW